MLGKIKINLKLNLMPKSNFFDTFGFRSDKSSLIMSGWDAIKDGGSMYSVMFYTRGKKKVMARSTVAATPIRK